METNKQNTALLVVIAVATLLVAVVGATFAFFTSTEKNKEASSVQVSTARMNIKFADGTSALVSSVDIQPGPDALINKDFTITGINTATGNGVEGQNMDMPYKIEMVYTNEFTALTTGAGGLTYAFTCGEAASLDASKVTYSGDTAETILATAETEARVVLASGVFKPVANDNVGTTLNFNLKIWFKDTNEDQDVNKSKIFSGKIVINDGDQAQYAGTTAAA